VADFDGSSEELRTTFADAFETATDPLKNYEATFRQLDADPFELFVTDSLQTTNIKRRTVYQYRTAFDQWRTYMREIGRHPACPNDAHVRGFARWLQDERDNGAIETIRQKLHKLGRAYRFWQREPSLPHDHQYNPFALGREKIDWESFDDTTEKSPPPISLGELRAILGEIPDLRDQAEIVTQLKLGLRVGELTNIQLQDVNLEAPAIRAQYPKLGTHEAVADRPNAVYIPSKHERDGNKSSVSRILPLDDELQRVLRRYLRVRPTWVDSWLFFSKGDGPADVKAVNKAWKATFHPEYAETPEYRAVTSHFGRHYFTTFWRKEQQVSRELVQYMRGDRVGNPADDGSWMHHYLHTYYEDVEDLYRQNIYTLGIAE
jgi:integrase/recombinase XerD